MIELINVSKRYGAVQALHDVSLHVDRGEVLGLLGQNGAGKTTLINLLTGYLAPTSGHVLLDGADVLLEPEKARQHLGYLPEQPPVYDEMTVREYLRYAARLRNVERRSVPGHVDEIMELCGLTAMQHRLLSHLSKGYRQRAGFAQALCGDPEILVLDEPTVGLDPKQIVEIRGLIQKMGKGRTVVFSSHILTEVQQLCDRVVILHEGTIKTILSMNDQGEAEKDTVTVLLTAAAAEHAIVSWIKALEGVRKVQVQPSGKDGQTTMLITFHRQNEPERRLFALLSGLSIPILHLSRQENDLEQLFLKVISEESH